MSVKKTTKKTTTKKTSGHKPKTSTTKRTPARKPEAAAPAAATAEGERINRYLAGCGICSRREADRWIHEGRITLNNEPVAQPGVKVKPGDIVTVDGKPVARQEHFTYLLYNKPRGLLCSRKDMRGRPLIYDKLDIPANVQSVGRLDMDSEGLLILTDDGGMAQGLIHPGANLPRTYRVRITGIPELETLQKLRNGGIDMGRGDISDPWEVIVDAESRSHSWLTVTIMRGRWREVRRTLQAVGHEVRRLIRVRFGPLKLDTDLPSGAWRTLRAPEVRKLKSAAGRSDGS